MSIFNKRLNSEQVLEVEDFYRQLQEDPDRFTQEEKDSINHLYNRAKESDRLSPGDNTLMGKVVEGSLTPRQAIQHRRSVEEQYPTGKGRTQKLYKSLPFEKNISGDPYTNPNTILKQKEEEDRIQKEFEVKKQDLAQKRAEKYTEILGINPYEQEHEAFTQYFNSIRDNDEVMEQVMKDSQAQRDFYKKFQESLKDGTLENMPGIKEQIKADEDERKKIEKMEQKEVERKAKEPTLPSSGVDYAKKLQAEDKDLNSAWTYKDVAEGAHGIYDPLRTKVKTYLEDPTKENEDALNDYYKDLAYVRLDQDKPVFTSWDSVKDIAHNPWKYIPFGGWFEGTELYRIYSIAEKYNQDPSSVTNEELTSLREFVEYEAFKEHSTWAAGVTQIVTQMPAFAIEIAASGLTVAAGKKIVKETVLANINKFVKGGIKEKVKKEVAEKGLKKYGKGFIKGTATATVGTFASGDIKVREIENLMPGFEIQDGEIVKVYDGMDKLSAKRQAVLGTFIEFASEMTGAATMKFLKTIGGAPWKKIMSTKGGREFAEKYIKLSPETKNIVMNSAIVKAFKKLNPGASDADVDKIMTQFGYHGILEEMLEERMGEAARGFAKKLSDSGIVDGFDNPNWEWHIPSWYQLSQEFAGFLIPGAGRRIAISTKSKYQDSKFKENNPAIASMVDKFTSTYNKSKEQYNSIIDKVNEEGENLLDEDQKNRITELKNKDKLSEEEAQELTGLIITKTKLGETSLSKEEIDIIDSHEQNKLKYNTITYLKNLIIENPEISDVIDLSEVNLEKELSKTAQELEEEYGEDFLKGEGESNKNEVYKILGFTTAANIQTGERVKLGLKKGATIDTVIEEYYGLIRRGGLTEKQTKAYDEHYEKYQTDKEYRKKINEHINEVHNKMGLGDRLDNTNDALSYEKLFDIEGKTHEYQSHLKTPKDAVDKIYNYISKLFNKGMGRWELNDEIKDLYKQIQKRKLKVKPEVAKEEEDKPKVKAKPKAKPKKAKPKKPKKKPEKKDKPSYQITPASLSNQKYGAIKGFVKELAKEGEPARFWYEQSGKALLDITGGNKEEAKKLLSIIAITSPQMDVSTNFGQMIKGYYKAIKGDKPLAGRFPKAMAERIEKVMAGKDR